MKRKTKSDGDSAGLLYLLDPQPNLDLTEHNIHGVGKALERSPPLTKAAKVNLGPEEELIQNSTASGVELNLKTMTNKNWKHKANH